MKEIILKEYFEGNASCKTLNREIQGSFVKTGFDTRTLFIDTIKEKGEYNVTKNHILKIIEDGIRGSLSPSDINTLAFALIGSEYFHLDNNQIEKVIFDWDMADMNFGITLENLKLWKHYLESGEYLLK